MTYTKNITLSSLIIVFCFCRKVVNILYHTELQSELSFSPIFYTTKFVDGAKVITKR